MIADLPGRLVIDGGPLGHGHSLAEVDKPNASLSTVVYEQERAADQLQKRLKNVKFMCTGVTYTGDDQVL